MKSLLFKIAMIALLPALATSCMTTYDRYGNPVQSVDPGAAAAIAVGAAAVGVAAGRNQRKREVHHYPVYQNYPRGGYYGYGHRGYGHRRY